MRRSFALLGLLLSCGGSRAELPTTAVAFPTDLGPRSISACEVAYVDGSVRTVLDASYNGRVTCSSGNIGGTAIVVQRAADNTLSVQFNGCGGNFVTAATAERSGSQLQFSGKSEERTWSYDLAFRGACAALGTLIVRGARGEVEVELAVDVTEQHHPVTN